MISLGLGWKAWEKRLVFSLKRSKPDRFFLYFALRGWEKGFSMGFGPRSPRWFAPSWVINGVRPRYRLAVRLVKSQERWSTSTVVNRALRFYLKSKYPELLDQAAQLVEAHDPPHEGGEG